MTFFAGWIGEVLARPAHRRREWGRVLVLCMYMFTKLRESFEPWRGDAEYGKCTVGSGQLGMEV